MPFTPFTRDSHKRVLSFVSLSKEKHFKERKHSVNHVANFVN
jgi:hypothetical protein